jgi:hypothetical protein
MLKTLARFALLRVLPRRILPIVTVVEGILFLRGIRNRSRVPVNPPTRSRTAPPGTSLAGAAATTPASDPGPATRA